METMDRLFAPWRLEYVTHVDDVKGCFLCAARDSADDEKSLVLWRGERSEVFGLEKVESPVKKS
jgi:hypothetical protein